MEKHTLKNIDIALLKRLKEGDEAAFESIYWKYNSHVFNFINSLLYDRILSEDITQSVFMKIWEKHESIDLDKGFDAYLFTIARNMVYKETENRLLSESAFYALSQQQTNEDVLTEEKIDADSLRLYIDKLIEQLPLSRKEIFKLSRRDHLSNKEIAIRLSISEKTVETQLYRSLRFLKQKLSDDNLLAILLVILANEC
ncbi:RNA polymerase sigma-70 factor [Parabacteroides gordonii]|uniref:RNA polymerase sigma factor n=1 Tax=Parabacteroides gordonii MS-1 = DSM 23371 TaxID=1203610 RepID=A0A0F5JI60_9BACT|nr:RNA polymerase sigma-70 factor [Parabacteroides gordonii]KKB57409.1 RNA polymerase sigma-70 factor [Parabacteroides gordonii MS-1 = DSM 23371]MCA5582501.1 RNA polymerase sigma-70 factor [Parabacteroides gordonii]RGP17789.1 RNA polymerase sigma-70 factor [Parabacteroides gordonii]